MAIRFTESGNSDGPHLFLLVHGMEQTAASLGCLTEAIQADFPKARIVRVTYPASRWSNVSLLEVAKACVKKIDFELAQMSQEEHPEIILVGHSLGALLVRKICLLAHGICTDYDVPHLNPVARPWANRIERLVLLAGMSRGWRLRPRNKHTPLSRWLARGCQLLVARSVGRGRLVRAAHRGSPFVVNLRLDWLAFVNADYEGQRPPDLVVQIAGSWDTVVNRDDHIDLQAGRNFRYLSVEGTSHNALVHFDDTPAGAERKLKFLYALHAIPEEFQSDLVLDLKRPDPTVTQVILLLHGIRDYGTWQEELRDDLKTGAAKRNLKIATSISNYDYLPLLPFLFGYGRTVHLERFMDRYAEMRAQYPQAECSFFGHSNGTYLLSAALMQYRAPRFARVGFAGSIVQRNFPWLNKFQTRVNAVRNYVASADAVVAIFPSLFEMIRLLPLFHEFPFNRDFGSGGHTGFTQLNDDVRNIAYIAGGHGAALEPKYRESIVSFLLGDAAPVLPEVVQKQNGWVVFAHKACAFVWLAILAGCSALFYASLVANERFGLRWPVLPAMVIVFYVFALFRY